MGAHWIRALITPAPTRDGYLFYTRMGMRHILNPQGVEGCRQDPTIAASNPHGQGGPVAFPDRRAPVVQGR